MSSHAPKPPFPGINPDDPFRIQELTQAITNSALSEGKKMAYLYMIADGSFSLDVFEGLKKDMDEAEKKLLRKIAYREKKRASHNARKAILEQEIAVLTPLATKEVQGNLDQLVAAVAREEEAGHQETKEKNIADIKTKLSSQE